MNICLLGLSGSGKTCYLYTASHVLSKGINIQGHTISATCSNRQQLLRLNRGIEQMSSGTWPDGSISTITYPYDFKIDGKIAGNFTVYDYRGGALDGMKDDDIDDSEVLFDTFEDSSCIIFLIDGDTVLSALEPEDLDMLHQDIFSFQSQLKARNKINYIESLIRECLVRIKKNNVPILLSITKKDIFSEKELQAGKGLLKELLPSVFSLGNDMIVGVTAVTLGENLRNDEGNLTGILCLNTDGNVHIPLLFALLQNIEEDPSSVENSQVVKNMIHTLFTSKNIEFYRGGKPAIIL